MSNFTFTSESVSEGHPDKVCDAISESHVACEILVTTGTVIVSGEIRSNATVDVEKVVRETLGEIGYTDKAYGMDNKNVKILLMLDEQSPEIAQGVDEGSGLHNEQGAGDQGLMFGFACNETKELMPIPIHLAHRLVERMTALRKEGTISWLRPDSKSQVSVAYENGKPSSITKVVIATQHDDMLNKFESEKAEHDFVESEIIEKVIIPILNESGLPYETDFIVNGTGRFVFGGPEADTGLTGRKIIVDTYGGYAPHGGGAFSGKDPSKVDRSAAYMARYIAKNIVAANIADKCEVQLSYSIGVAEPTSFYVKSFNTSDLSDEELTEVAKKVFPVRPGGIINHLKLKFPRYKKTAANGHFGREDELFTWEKTDMVEKLKSMTIKGA
jgi:S-adenosylmethionine synthetase